MASRAITALFEEHLRPSGLQGASQFTLLCAIALIGEVSISRLASALLMDRTTVTRTLKSLQASGWVQVASGTDRRERMVTITDPGREVLRRAIPLWRNAQSEIVGHLSVDRWTALMDGLQAAATVGSTTPR